MTYRVYTQPLTEKSNNIAKTGELIVDIENGHVSVKNSLGDTVSSTKKTEANIDLQKYLVTYITDLISDLETYIGKTEEEYEMLNSDTSSFLSRINTINNTISDLSTLLKTIESTNSNNSFQLWTLYNTINSMISSLMNSLPSFFIYERQINELSYIDNILGSYKNSLATENTTIKSRYAQVLANVNSRVDNTTYTSFRESISNRYAALVTSSAKLQKLTFK